LREETPDAVVQALQTNEETRYKTASACCENTFEAWVVRYRLTAERKFGVEQLDDVLLSAAEVIARTAAEEVARAAAEEVARAAAEEVARAAAEEGVRAAAEEMARAAFAAERTLAENTQRTPAQRRRVALTAAQRGV